MRIIITKEQKKIITEALGIPESINDASEVFFDLFANNLRSIRHKEDEYTFSGNVNILIGGKKKIKIDEYNLLVVVNDFEEFTERPKIVSFGMGTTFSFDRELMKKKIESSTTATFRIEFIAPVDWKPKELYDEFIKDKNDTLSSLSHELKHKYDQEIKQVGLIGKESDYNAIRKMPRMGIPILDEKFMYYLYFTSAVENLVRTTEVGSKIKTNRIKKSEFREFLKNDRTFKTLVDIKNFRYEDIIEGIRSNMDRVNEIFNHLELNPEEYTEEEKINLILEVFYSTLTKIKAELFNNMVEKPLDIIGALIASLGGTPISHDDKEEEVEKIKDNYFNYILKYNDNPSQFFKDEIKIFHNVSEKLIRKIGKLYDLAEDNVSESSIVDEAELTEKCWKGYTQKGMKTMFGKRYPNCVKKKK